jgi:hypothetical protein
MDAKIGIKKFEIEVKKYKNYANGLRSDELKFLKRNPSD